MDKNKCLHCGDGIPNYCERCYQDLVAENLRLQTELKKQKEDYEFTIMELIKN